MRIAIVTDAWLPQINGVVTTLMNTIQRLVAMGHEIDVIEPSQYPGFDMPGLHGLKLAIPPFRLADRIDAADAVHIVSEGALGIGAKLYCDRVRRSYTTAFHTNYAVYLNKHFHLPLRIGFAFLRWFHRHSAAVMVPSKSMIKILEQEGFANTVHWRRGVDATIFHPTPQYAPGEFLRPYGEGPYWLNVGRVSKEKNLDAFLSLDLPGTKIVVGDGPDMERLRKRYPKVNFVGARRGHELADFYRAADCFVFPSRFDTYGLVMAEALACGTPVAAFPVTGPIDIVTDSINGILDEDLEVACLSTLTLPTIDEQFDWDVATKDFVSNLVPVNKQSREFAIS